MAVLGNELHDIADPRPLLPGIEVPLWFWLCLVTLVFAAVSLALFLLLRHRKPPAPPELPFYEESRGALDHLRESLSGRSLAEVATEASLVIRHYLVATLQEPALYETHEEFIMRSDALQGLPAGARERLGPLLDQLARAKYGPSTTDLKASDDLVASCLDVLQGVESTRTRQVA
ncbi:MAG: hypothetical protein GWO24_10875 [Akkermansiaceae bacterium]|nr:hypothetical protein [Akkermansiaceae bacterium]